jgi:hypothetical protein
MLLMRLTAVNLTHAGAPILAAIARPSDPCEMRWKRRLCLFSQGRRSHGVRQGHQDPGESHHLPGSRRRCMPLEAGRGRPVGWHVGVWKTAWGFAAAVQTQVAAGRRAQGRVVVAVRIHSWIVHRVHSVSQDQRSPKTPILWGCGSRCASACRDSAVRVEVKLHHTGHSPCATGSCRARAADLLAAKPLRRGRARGAWGTDAWWRRSEGHNGCNSGAAVLLAAVRCARAKNPRTPRSTRGMCGDGVPRRPAASSVMRLSGRVFRRLHRHSSSAVAGDPN